VPGIDPAAPPAAPSGTSSSRLLDDEQIRVNGSSVERYYHYYVRVENTAGLDDLSQLKFNFEPSYQQLTIHFVRIIRGGSIINGLDPSEVKMIQEEEDLDQQLYNGTSAALIFVNDIRVGDVMEYAYTVTGDNPVLGGRFAENIYVGDTDPIQELSLRLVFPSNRQLSIKNDNLDLQPTKQTLGSDTEYLWSVKNVKAISLEDSTPDWFDPYPRINLSEFQSWADVVNWALPFYQNATFTNPELKSKIEEWKKAETPEQRTVPALRFVQDEIRYLGIELGRYSHQPSTPEKVFLRRFGDCKDKSLLLSSILNAMGIEAAPALVNTRLRSSLDSWQATPFAFDHVIVKASMNGKSYWLDPTISYQRGGLDSYYDPPYERGLILRAGSATLEKIPIPASGAGSTDIVETYNGENGGAISLSVTKTYRGMDADQMRYSLSSQSPDDIIKSHLNSYAETTPSIKADGLPVVEDDQKTNTIVIKEKFLISELWRESRHSFVADRIYAELGRPHVLQRSSPLEIRYPLSIKQTILINLGPGYDFPSESDVLTDDAMRFEYGYSKSGNQLSLTCSLKTFAASVPAAALERHLQILEQAQNYVGYDLNRGQVATAVAKPGPPSGSTFVIVLLILVGSIAVIAVALLRKRVRGQRKTQFVRESQARPGLTPETALRMASEAQLHSFLLNYSCRCGSRVCSADSSPKRERFMYDGQRLVCIRLQCDACKQSTDLYFNPLFENERGAALAGLSTS